MVGVQEPEHIVLFGAGKQVESHINIFLRHYPGIRICTIVNRTLNKRALDLVKAITTSFPHVTFQLFSLLEQESIEKAVRTADIIICATSSVLPLFPSSWVKSGTHVILVGSYKPSMQEVEETLVKRAVPGTQSIDDQQASQVLIVDSRSACMQEAGDLLKAGADSASILEIGELISRKRGQSQQQLEVSSPPPMYSEKSSHPVSFTGPITMFKSVGVGLQDVIIAKEVVSHAKNTMGVGTLIERYDATF